MTRLLPDELSCIIQELQLETPFNAQFDAGTDMPSYLTCYGNEQLWNEITAWLVPYIISAVRPFRVYRRECQQLCIKFPVTCYAVDKGHIISNPRDQFEFYTIIKCQESRSVAAASLRADCPSLLPGMPCPTVDSLLLDAFTPSVGQLLRVIEDELDAVDQFNATIAPLADIAQLAERNPVHRYLLINYVESTLSASLMSGIEVGEKCTGIARAFPMACYLTSHKLLYGRVRRADYARACYRLKVASHRRVD